MGRVLLEVTSGQNLQASLQLQQLNTELTGLVMCVAMADPKRLQTIHASRMDAGSTESNLNEPDYAAMVVRNL